MNISLKLSFLDEILKDDNIKQKYQEFVYKHTNIKDEVKKYMKEIDSIIPKSFDIDYCYYDYEIDEYEIVENFFSLLCVEKMIKDYDINGLINTLIALYLYELNIEILFDEESYKKEWIRKAINLAVKSIDFSKFSKQILKLFFKYRVDDTFDEIYNQIIVSNEKYCLENIDKLPDTIKIKIYSQFHINESAKK